MVDMSVCEINFGDQREQRDVCETGNPCSNNDEFLKQIMESQREDQKARAAVMQQLLKQMNQNTVDSQRNVLQLIEKIQEQTIEMIANLPKPPRPQKCFLTFCW